MGNTDFLFVTPSFVNGMGRSIDLFGSFSEYNISKTPQEADARALRNDVRAIGDDFKKAFNLLDNYAK